MNKPQITILNFGGTNCPKCKAMYPAWNSFSAKYPQYQYKYINLHEVGETEANSYRESFGITALPTFIVLQDKNVIGGIRGQTMTLSQFETKLLEIINTTIN